jgi:hypothetical protein
VSDEDLSLDPDFIEPLDKILDSGMFTLKNNFERRKGRSDSTALVTIMDFMPINAQTTTNFFSDGLSMGHYVHLK